MARKKLAFGTQPAENKDTRTSTKDIVGTPQSGSHWIQGAKDTMTLMEQDEINTQYVPVEYIQMSGNPRNDEISVEKVKEIKSKCPVDRKEDGVTPTLSQEDYIAKVRKVVALSDFELERFKKLVETAFSMLTPEALIHPVTVWQNETTFHLVAGQRRWLCHVLLSSKVLKSYILDKTPTLAEQRALGWTENEIRDNMSLPDRVNTVAQMIADSGVSLEQMSDTRLSLMISKSKAIATRYLAILRCPHAELLEHINNGNITSLQDGAKYAKKEPDEITAFATGTPLTPNNKPSLPNKAKPYIVFKKDAPTSKLRQLVEAAAKGLNNEKSLEGINLDKNEGIREALERLLDSIKESK